MRGLGDMLLATRFAHSIPVGARIQVEEGLRSRARGPNHVARLDRYHVPDDGHVRPAPRDVLLVPGRAAVRCQRDREEVTGVDGLVVGSHV